MTRWGTIVTSLIVGLGLAGLLPGPLGAQTRLVVPIVIQGMRSASPPAAAPSIQITTRTLSPQPGVTRTEVTVRDTTGFHGFSGMRSSLRPGETRVTVQDATGVHGFSGVRRNPAQPGEARVTVQDTTGLSGFSSGRSRGLPPGTTTTHVTLQDTTGLSGFASGRPPALLGAATTSGPLPAPGDGSTVVVPFPMPLRPPMGGTPQSLTITAEGPIDAPIVILSP